MREGDQRRRIERDARFLTELPRAGDAGDVPRVLALRRVRVGGLDRAAREHMEVGTERHRGRAPGQEELRLAAVGRVTEQDDRGRGSRDHVCVRRGASGDRARHAPGRSWSS